MAYMGAGQAGAARATRASRRGFTRSGLLAGLLVLVIAGVCVRLGIWQLDRLEQRRARNAAVREAMALPPLDLQGDSLRAVLRDPDAYVYRRVRVRGEYLAEAEVVQRGRAFQGRPGGDLLTPLQVAGTSQAVLVLRGWAPSPDAMTLDPRPLLEPGVREVEGILQRFPREVDDARLAELDVDGEVVTTIQRLDVDFLKQHSPLPLLPLYVQQVPGGPTPAGLERRPLPELDEGPHLGYAIQWFSFALIALGGYLILVWRARRTSRAQG